MRYARINTLLVVVIVVINSITIGLPFVPNLVFAAQSHQGRRQTLEAKVSATPPLADPDHSNRLILPAALAEQQIFDGSDARTLNKGIWRRPASSTPDKGGNTVLAAHRFTYTNPRGAFYHLDKVKVGDIVGVVWNDALYRYKVTSIRTVGPHETSIEKPTTQPQLTLYTCTPLTLPKDRLVVTATLESSHER